MTYLADNAYLAIKPETTAGVAVIPTEFVPLVSEAIKTVVNHSVDRRMKGHDWQGNDLLRGNRSHEGELSVLADPDTLGHILNMVFTKGTTTGDADGYTHPFTVGNGDSYTFEIKKGMYAQRFFGVHADEVTLEFDEGQLVANMSVKAMGQVGIMSLGVALTGAGMTDIVLDDEYDLNPSRGLVVGDVLVIGSDEVTILTIDADGVTITFASATLTYSVGEAIYLKPQTVIQPSLQDPFYMGNALVGIGADESTATTNAGAKATATPAYDMAITFRNNLFAQNGTSQFDPVTIAPRTREAGVNLSQLFESEAQRQAFLDRAKQAITAIFKGKFIKSDFTTQELLTLKCHKVKLIENDNALEVGEFIKDEQNFAVLYDDTDAKALTVELVNRTAGTDY